MKWEMYRTKNAKGEDVVEYVAENGDKSVVVSVTGDHIEMDKQLKQYRNPGTKKQYDFWDIEETQCFNYHTEDEVKAEAEKWLNS